MGCWKWFNSVLQEANVTITDKNKTKIDDLVHKYSANNPATATAPQTGKKPAEKSKKAPK